MSWGGRLPDRPPATFRYPIATSMLRCALSRGSSTFRRPSRLKAWNHGWQGSRREYAAVFDAVDIPTLKASWGRTGGEKRLVEVTGARAHMLAGDLLQPETTPEVTEPILAFLRGSGIAP